jgi:hypothetical protein
MTDHTNRTAALNRALLRINRYTAYLLIAVTLLMLITGYRMTGNFAFISRGLADLLHRIHLNIVFLFLFVLHTLLSIRVLIIRRGLWRRYLDVVFIIIGTGILGFFSYYSLKLIVRF